MLSASRITRHLLSGFLLGKHYNQSSPRVRCTNTRHNRAASIPTWIRDCVKNFKLSLTSDIFVNNLRSILQDTIIFHTEGCNSNAMIDILICRCGYDIACLHCSSCGWGIVLHLAGTCSMLRRRLSSYVTDATIS